MDAPETVPEKTPPPLFMDARSLYFSDRTLYLYPSRYFHFYLFCEHSGRNTCWLPEGYVE